MRSVTERRRQRRSCTDECRTKNAVVRDRLFRMRGGSHEDEDIHPSRRGAICLRRRARDVGSMHDGNRCSCQEPVRQGCGGGPYRRGIGPDPFSRNPGQSASSDRRHEFRRHKVRRRLPKTYVGKQRASHPRRSSGTPAQHPPTAAMGEATQGQTAPATTGQHPPTATMSEATRSQAAPRAAGDANTSEASITLAHARTLDQQGKEAECMEAVGRAKQLAGPR